MKTRKCWYCGSAEGCICRIFDAFGERGYVTLCASCATDPAALNAAHDMALDVFSRRQIVRQALGVEKGAV